MTTHARRHPNQGRLVPGDDVARDAALSDHDVYRWWLTRRWSPGGRVACFVMLNPSTADAERDDPTTRRCIGFARSWGCHALAVVNLYAYRAADPKVLDTLDEQVAVGWENRGHVLAHAHAAERIVAAWGATGTVRQQRERNARGRDLLSVLDRPILCLGRTAGGSPRHPLYVPAAKELEPWT